MGGLDFLTNCGKCIMIDLPPERVAPLYTVFRYNEQIYKIIRFKGHRSSIGLLDHSQDEHHDEKLDSSYSRAKKTILELGLANHWDYFFTGTFNPKWVDRYNLPALDKSLKQWFRDQRKKYSADIAFVLIPEQHLDGAWHFHGFLSGVPSACLADFVEGIHPSKLCGRGFKYWIDFEEKFGFCSLSPIRDPVACAFYMSKYISKDLSSRKDLGIHLYSCSHGLSRSLLWLDEYVSCPDFDKFLTHNYKFCSTGFTKTSDGLDWTFGLDHCQNLLPLFDSEPQDIEGADNDIIFEQLYFAGSSKGRTSDFDSED